MYCIACGAPNSEQDKFCMKCGKPLVTGVGQAATAAPSVFATPSTAYRNGDKLVVPNGAPLPGYCVKCGEPVTGELVRKKFQWHNPWLVLLVLISPIVYLIVALIVVKRAELLVPMCPEHIQRRKNLLIATWVLLLGFIPAGIFVGSLISDYNTAVLLGMLTSLVVLIAAGVTGIGTVIMRPHEITATSATFAGVCEPFLTKLPTR